VPALAIIAAVLGAAGWRLGLFERLMGHGQGEAVADEVGIPVTTAKVVVTDMTSMLHVTGTVEPDREAALASKIGGKVVAVTVDEGEPVTAGQVVVRLDDSDVRAQVSQARAAVQAAQAARGLAQARLDLALAGARPQERRQAEANVGQAQAALGAAKAALEALRKGAREQERAQAEQAVRQAKAGLDNAQANLRRAQELFDSGAVSEQQVDLARTQYEVARAQYETAKEQLDLVREGPRAEDIQAAEAQVNQAQAALVAAQQQYSLLQEGAREEDIRAAREQLNQAHAGVAQAQAALEAALVALDNTVIRSALTGEVAERQVDPGHSILPGQPLLEVVDNRRVYVKAKVSESEVRKVRPGQEVEVRADAYPGEVFVGTVSDILPAADVETRMFVVKIRLPNPRGVLKSGMFARCEITVERVQDVAAVPRRAILREKYRAAVFVVWGDRANLVTVKLGIEQGDLVQVISGVRPGQAVVVDGQDSLRENDAVRVMGAG